MQKKTTVVVSKEEMGKVVMQNATDGVVAIKVPRAKDGEVAAAPFAVVTIPADMLAASLAAAIEVDVDDLAGMEMSCKKDGSIELTY